MGFFLFLSVWNLLEFFLNVFWQFKQENTFGSISVYMIFFKILSLSAENSVVPVFGKKKKKNQNQTTQQQPPLNLVIAS